MNFGCFVYLLVATVPNPTEINWVIT